jgi:hypothetical protein
VVVSGVLGNVINTNHVVDSLATSNPITLVYSDNFFGDFGEASGSILSPERMAQIESAGMTNAIDSQFQQQGFVPLRTQNISITLEGDRSQAVQILSLTPRSIKCDSPLAGTIMITHPEGSNDDPQLYYDLDAHQPMFMQLENGSTATAHAPYFDKHTFTLAKGEELTVAVTAHVKQKHCLWVIDANELVDGSPTTQTFGAEHPWEVTGTAELSDYKERFVKSYLYDSAKKSEWTPENYQWFCQKQGCGIDDWIKD